MSEVIVITSGKGGVGKTTTVANIGTGLAMLGKKVVVVDTDIGLRNLDVVLGLENRIVYNLVDVINGSCRLRQALIKDKRHPELCLLPSAQTKDKSAVSPEQMIKLTDDLREQFDYILLDCPAGIEQGFKNAIAGADKALVVTTPEVSAIRDADRIIGLLEANEIRDISLIINRLRPDMIARGDMATETDFTEPPVIQKRIIKTSNRLCKPAITATQMLESMTHQPLPTRAEASDVANAIYDRTSAIMLSGECAQGDYPVECVQTMVKIANRVEPEIDYWKRFRTNDNIDLSDFETKVAYSTCVTAMNMGADAIVCYTNSGNSARKLAGLGAGCPILAVTDNRRTFNQLALAWNVTPVFVEKAESIDATVENGIKKLQDKGILEKGDTIVISGGPSILKNAEESKIVASVAKV